MYCLRTFNVFPILEIKEDWDRIDSFFPVRILVEVCHISPESRCDSGKTGRVRICFLKRASEYDRFHPAVFRIEQFSCFMQMADHYQIKMVKVEKLDNFVLALSYCVELALGEQAVA